MKRLTLLLSVALHTLLLLLLVRMRFEARVRPPEKVIQVVPVQPVLLAPAPPSGNPPSQPNPAQPQPAPQPPAAQAQPPAPPGDAPIVVRPFVQKGGEKGEGRGQPEGEENQGGSEARPPEPVPSKPTPAPPPPPEPVAEEPGSRRLHIDIDAINRRLRELEAAERDQAPPFASRQQPQGVPFGTPRGLQDEFGDGTSSTAIGGSAFFDARGYDITPWARRAVYGVKRNWIFPPAGAYGLPGVVGVYLVVERDGRVSTLAVRKASGVKPYDQAAVNAVTLASPFPPLPPDFPNPNLPAYFVFRYN